MPQRKNLILISHVLGPFGLKITLLKLQFYNNSTLFDKKYQYYPHFFLLVQILQPFVLVQILQ